MKILYFAAGWCGNAAGDVLTDFHHAAIAGQEQDRLELGALHFASEADALARAAFVGGHTCFDSNTATYEVTLLGSRQSVSQDRLVVKQSNAFIATNRLLGPKGPCGIPCAPAGHLL